MLSSLWASNLNFGKGFLQLGESVNIGNLAISQPGPPLALGGIVAKNDLKSRAERQLFGDLAPAPAGDLGNAVNISSQPAGAV
jgi:hypothetical protein